MTLVRPLRTHLRDALERASRGRHVEPRPPHVAAQPEDLAGIPKNLAGAELRLAAAEAGCTGIRRITSSVAILWTPDPRVNPQSRAGSGGGRSAAAEPILREKLRTVTEVASGTRPKPWLLGAARRRERRVLRDGTP